jgi:MATE family multidrug resistance protein
MAALAFMVPLGISGAATTRVGNAIGAGRPAAARRSAAVCLALGAGVMLGSASMFALFPRFLARFYTPDQEVIALVAVLLPIAALFQVFDGLQVVGAGVLRGAGDTRLPAILAVCGYWGLGLPLGWWLGLHSGWGPRGLWWGLTLGLASVAILLLLRARRHFAGDLRALA